MWSSDGMYIFRQRIIIRAGGIYAGTTWPDFT